jgi:hypothetical protein
VQAIIWCLNNIDEALRCNQVVYHGPPSRVM